MAKSTAVNIVIFVAVIGVVGGVAWYRSAQQGPPPAQTADRALPAGPTADAAAGGRTAASQAATDTPAGDPPVRSGEICPQTQPATSQTSAAAQPESRPAAVPASQPARAAKLPRVVDLGADKCIPCKKLAPILEELKKEYEGRVIVEFIDVWKDPEAGKPYSIRLIPTQVFYNAEGKEVWRHEGFLPKADFVAKFRELGAK